MNDQQAPTPSNIAHIDEIFAGSSLQGFLDAKLAQLLAGADSPLPVPTTASDPLAHCLLDSEAELLDFLRQRLEHLKTQAGQA